MIRVKAPQVSYENEIAELTKVFFPGEQVTVMMKKEHAGSSKAGCSDEELPLADTVLETGYTIDKPESIVFYAFLWQSNTIICEYRTAKPLDADTEDSANGIRYGSYQLSREDLKNPARKSNRLIKNGLKACVFELLKKHTGQHPKWGAMTGIRPVKLVHEMLDKGMDDINARQELLTAYKLHPEKANLLIRTARNQRPFIDRQGTDRASVYINIPFCPTRCHYCSFPSDLIGRVESRMDAYLECLKQEITAVMNQLSRTETQVDTIYIGGGTPTVLEHSKLETLLRTVHEQIVSGYPIREYTVEAGRPDSLDTEKLYLMKEYGVTRLSINPQSMNQETLNRIGRGHTVEQLVQVYKKAREIEFDSINMDVILGLPGETAEHFQRTMSDIAVLDPDNITVHTLAVKRASAWKEEYAFNQYDSSRKGIAEEMASVSREWMDRLGMEPYYLYRQKYMLDHLENVGYSLPGKECLYNIQFMHESRDVWAFGAGASSKIYYPAEDRLERIGNVKNLDDYLYRIDEMIGRKLRILKGS
jgi:coproporphyrinogen dehydrogenase HemZ